MAHAVPLLYNRYFLMFPSLNPSSPKDHSTAGCCVTAEEPHQQSNCRQLSISRAFH